MLSAHHSQWCSYLVHSTQAMLHHAHTAQRCCSQAHPALWWCGLKTVVKLLFFFSTPALKELGKGRSWFIFLIVKTRCTRADKTFFGSPRSPFNLISSTHESSLLSTSVSVLDGSNYLVWKNQMRAWLQSKGLWQITNRNEKKFQELDPSTTAAAHEVNYKQCMDWDNKEDHAYSTILLWVNPSVAVVANSCLTAKLYGRHFTLPSVQQALRLRRL